MQDGGGYGEIGGRAVPLTLPPGGFRVTWTVARQNFRRRKGNVKMGNGDWMRISGIVTYNRVIKAIILDSEGPDKYKCVGTLNTSIASAALYDLIF